MTNALTFNLHFHEMVDSNNPDSKILLATIPNINSKGIIASYLHEYNLWSDKNQYIEMSDEDVRGISLGIDLFHDKATAQLLRNRYNNHANIFVNIT